MIREAFEADIPRIVEMGTRFLKEGPYRDQLGEPVKAAELALQIIKNQNGRILLYVDDEGKIQGVLAMIVFPHYFTGELTAGEIIWYIEPESRNGKSFDTIPALQLMRAAEALAKLMGATRMQFTAPIGNVGKIYERFGYHAIETSYQRELL